MRGRDGDGNGRTLLKMESFYLLTLKRLSLFFTTLILFTLLLSLCTFPVHAQAAPGSNMLFGYPVLILSVKITLWRSEITWLDLACFNNQSL